MSRRRAVDSPPRDDGLVVAAVGGLRAHALSAGAAATASSALGVGPASSSALPWVLPLA